MKQTSTKFFARKFPTKSLNFDSSDVMMISASISVSFVCGWPLTGADPSTATIFNTGNESVERRKTSPNAPSPICKVNYFEPMYSAKRHWLNEA